MKRIQPDRAELVDRAFALLRQTEVPEGPSAQVLSAILEAGQSTMPAPRPTLRRTRQIRIAGRAKLAVALVVVVAAGLGISYLAADRNQSAALADVCEQIRQAKTATWTQIQNPGADGENGPSSTMRCAYRRADRRLRMAGTYTHGGVTREMIHILDGAAGRHLRLYPDLKLAKLEASSPRAVPPVDPITLLREMIPASAEPLAERRIDGRKAVGFRIDPPWKGTTDLWIDVETNRVVLVEWRHDWRAPLAGSGPPDALMRDIVFDPELDDAWFRLEVPEGYRLLRGDFREGDVAPDELRPDRENGDSSHRIDRPRYLIVTDVPEGVQDGYARAVGELAKLRTPVAVVRFDDQNASKVLQDLGKHNPHYVAFVVHPERVEANFVGRVFEAMTELDDDPYLDCAYGFITGRTADDAIALVRNTAVAEAEPDAIPRKFVAIAHTFAENDLAPFAHENATRFESYGYQTATINPVDGSPEWQRKSADEIDKLNGASLIFVAGHGMGDSLCGVPGERLAGITLQSAVVVNGTCHSGVACIRYDSTDRRWTMKKTRIDPKKSVSLNLVRAGAVGQFASTASSSWQNVGFTIPKFFHSGSSLGESLRDALNDKIRRAEIQEIDVLPFQEGERSPQSLPEDGNPGGIQSLSRVVLIGDPAYRPFPKGHPAIPSRTQTVATDESTPKELRIQSLIEKLSDPREPRFRALNQLIKLGEDAVPALLAESETNRNWQISKALGEIGDRRAIGPLIGKLRSDPPSPTREVVQEALQRITGKDFGPDAEAWQAWWNEQKGQN